MRDRDLGRIRKFGVLLLGFSISASLLPGDVIADASDRRSAAAARKGEILDISLEGKRLHRLKGRSKGDEFGTDIGADVVPGTDRGGCAIGAPGWSSSTGRVVVHDCFDTSGIAGPLLFTVDGDSLVGGDVERFGETLANLGHVDGDSSVHWAVGAPGVASQEGADAAVVVLHEVNGTLGERMRLSADPETRLGWIVQPLQVNPGTSFFSSFVVGAPGQARGSKQRAGAVYRIDTVSGEILWTLEGNKRNLYFGYSIVTIGDVDGDDFQDLLIGAPGRAKRKPAGSVWLVSGATGRVIERLPAPDDAVLFGFSVGSGDIDGDGNSDVIVSAPRTATNAGVDAGVVFVFDLAGSEILRWEGETAGQWLGIDVSPVLAGTTLEVTGLAASSLFVNEARPKKTMRGGLEFYSIEDAAVIGRRLGKRANDRLGWRILSCVGGCRVGMPRAPDFFLPGD